MNPALACFLASKEPFKYLTRGLKGVNFVLEINSSPPLSPKLVSTLGASQWRPVDCQLGPLRLTGNPSLRWEVVLVGQKHWNIVACKVKLLGSFAETKVQVVKPALRFRQKAGGRHMGL